jgi:Bacterial PH domain
MAHPHRSGSPVEIFHSGVDPWLIAVVLLATLGSLGVAMVVPSTRGGLSREVGIAIAGGTAGLVLLLFYWSYRTTTYVLDVDSLRVRCAGLRWQIAYRDVRRVEFSNSALSAPALSLRRLKVCYGAAGSLVISPDDREAFIAALQRRVPGLEVVR